MSLAPPAQGKGESIAEDPELQELSTTSFYWRRSGRTMLRLGYYAARNYLHHRLMK